MAGFDFVWTVQPGPTGSREFPFPIAPAQSSGYSVVLWNIGSNTVYYGDNTVTYATGTPLAPGDVVDLQSASSPVYAVSDPGEDTTVATQITAAVSAGATSVLVPTIDPQQPHFNQGSWVRIDDGTHSEIAFVSGNTTTSISFYVGLQFAYASGATVTVVEGRNAIVHTIGGSNG